MDTIRDQDLNPKSKVQNVVPEQGSKVGPLLWVHIQDLLQGPIQCGPRIGTIFLTFYGNLFNNYIVCWKQILDLHEGPKFGPGIEGPHSAEGSSQVHEGTMVMFCIRSEKRICYKLISLDIIYFFMFFTFSIFLEPLKGCTRFLNLILRFLDIVQINTEIQQGNCFILFIFDSDLVAINECYRLKIYVMCVGNF